MRQVFWQKMIYRATPIFGAALVGAIALLGTPKAAQAADCGPGVDWVDTCEAGSDHFRNSWINVHLWWNVPALEGVLGTDLPDAFPMEDWIMFKGPVWVDRAAGAGGVIETTLSHTLKGKHDFLGDLILETTGTGEIQDVGGGLADSFFDVEFTLNGMFGGSSTIHADRLLTGVPPDDPAVPPGPFTGVACPSTPDPESILIYCNLDSEPTDLFYLGADGMLGTGDDILVARIHREEHIIHPRTPEPSGALAVALLGLGTALGLRKKQKSG